MIGVVSKQEQRAAVEEFFQLFKTPWEFAQPGREYGVLLSTVDNPPATEAALVVFSTAGAISWDAGLGLQTGARTVAANAQADGGSLPLCTAVCALNGGGGTPLIRKDGEVLATLQRTAAQTTIRLGYDLFAEVEHLLRVGQPPENALVPTLDRHIELLRSWMIEAGVSFVEIPPVPAGKDFMVSLTHDIDFIGIRRHFCDHTMFGFLLRSTVGALKDVARGKIPVSRLLRIWWAVLKLPFVYLGMAKDFWLPFPWLMEVEKNLPATYYFIPFKGRAGDRLTGKDAPRRACAYDISDIPEWTKALQDAGCEIGVHGIDSWHDAAKGRDEIARVTAVTGNKKPGIRMHWLKWNDDSYRVLEEAGYSYDSTSGYNEAVGFRNGTAQVFRPLGRSELLEMPMHIQDGALFYPGRMDLNESRAWELCERVIASIQRIGGVATLLWHDRSHGPERFWGEFYALLVGKLRGMNVWFASGQQVTDWFRLRRSVTFRVAPGVDDMDSIEMTSNSAGPLPSLTVRVHRCNGAAAADSTWAGGESTRLSKLFSNPNAAMPAPKVVCA